MLAAMLLEWVAFQLDGPAQILVVELNRPADDLLITPLRASENFGVLALFLRRLLSPRFVRSRDGVSRLLLDRLIRGERVPATFYFHPWEIDPGQPRIDGLPPRARFRHYVNLGRMENKLARLIREFTWGSIDAMLDDYDGPLPRWAPVPSVHGNSAL